MRPRAAKGRFPYAHRSMAEVLHAEALQRATRTAVALQLVKMRIERPEHFAPAPERGECGAGDVPKADHGGGLEGRAADRARAPDVSREAPAAGDGSRRRIVPPECPPTPPATRPGKIDLAAAPSGMEAAAASMISLAADPAPIAAAPTGKAWCRCGGAAGGYVPASFGINCIEANCPLRGAV